MTDKLLQLIALAPPPENPTPTGSSAEWERVERDIGTALPDDYKALVNAYGCGSFGGFICLLNPFLSQRGPGSSLALRRGVEMLRGVEPFQREAPDAFQPFPVYPAAGGLLPWGKRCDDSDLMCWRTVGESGRWPTVLLDNDWSEEYLEFDTSATGFLVGWLTGRFKVSYYPPHPLALPLFRPAVATGA